MKHKQGAPVLEIKALGEDGLISGYGSVFGNKDSYGEIVDKGAFKRSLADYRRQKRLPKMFWQHDPGQPIGHWTDMAEDDTGLLVTGQLNMNVQKGREAYFHLRDGDIEGLSIGYRVIKETRDEANDAVILKELSLMEVSVVSLPANAEATVSAVKAAETEELISLLVAGDRLTERQWEKLLRGDPFNLSKSEAERVVRVHGLKSGQGEPDASDAIADFWAAMRAAPSST